PVCTTLFSYSTLFRSLDRLELIVREHVVVEVAGLEVAGREDQVRRLDRLDDVEDREPPRLQHRWVQIDVDLADLAAFDRRRGDGDRKSTRRNSSNGSI